jgi:hypothetical protein
MASAPWYTANGVNDHFRCQSTLLDDVLDAAEPALFLLHGGWQLGRPSGRWWRRHGVEVTMWSVVWYSAKRTVREGSKSRGWDRRGCPIVLFTGILRRQQLQPLRSFRTFLTCHCPSASNDRNLVRYTVYSQCDVHISWNDIKYLPSIISAVIISIPQ